MITLLKKIRSLLPNKWNSSGIKEKIADFFHPKFSYLIGFFERLNEVILFIPVLFKCVTWDHSSIYYILRHWLGRMEEVQRNDSCHTNAWKYAKQIKLCNNLLDRIIKDEYHDNVYAPHYEKWGKTKMIIDDKGFCNFTSSNIITPEEKEQEKKEYRNLMDKETYLVNQDIDLLFKTIKEEHRNWWT